MARRKIYPQAPPETLPDPLPDPPTDLAGSEWAALVPALAQGQHLDMLRTVEALRQQGRTVFPHRKDVFRALELTPPSRVRVVILGQDPYHGAGQAHGLAFSVASGVACPRSLGNIFKEIKADVGGVGRGYGSGENALLTSPDATPSCDLTRWARQGVLLLNTVLTVEEGSANAHARLLPGGGLCKAKDEGGWQRVTRAMLEALAAGESPASREFAVLLWGKPAQAYANIFDPARHLVLCAAHPSPLSASRGFFGCRHFSQVNAWLAERGLEPVGW